MKKFLFVIAGAWFCGYVFVQFLRLFAASVQR